jgi:hypothetical protein
MPPLSRIDMMKATRLTREGRLEEAMGVLQGALRPEPSLQPDGPKSNPGKEPGEPLIDMVPPSAASGPAWTTPTQDHVSSVESQGRAPSQRTPAAVRGLVDRIGGLGRGLGGEFRSQLGRPLRGVHPYERGRQPTLQALHSLDVQRRGSAARRHAARLHAVP